MKKILTCLLAAAMLLSLAACGSDAQEASATPEPTEEATPTPELPVTPEPTPTPEPVPQVQYIEIGETISTDVVEFTLDECRFAERIGLSTDNWFQPIIGKGGLVPGDGKIFMYFSFRTKNISKEELSGYKVCNVVVDYNDGFLYYDGSYSDGNYGWSTNQVLSKNVGLTSMIPLEEHEYRGYIECAMDVRDNRDAPLKVAFILPNSRGEEDFVYEMVVSEDLSNEAVYNAVQALGKVEDNLAFVVRNIDGAVGDNFAESFVNGMISEIDSIDVASIPKTLTDTIASIPQIQTQVHTVAGYLRPVNGSNVETVKNLCQDTISLIEGLLNGELGGL